MIVPPVTVDTSCKAQALEQNVLFLLQFATLHVTLAVDLLIKIVHHVLQVINWPLMAVANQLKHVWNGVTVTMNQAMFWELADVLMIVTVMAPEDAHQLVTVWLVKIWQPPSQINILWRIAQFVMTPVWLVTDLLPKTVQAVMTAVSSIMEFAILAVFLIVCIVWMMTKPVVNAKMAMSWTTKMDVLNLQLNVTLHAWNVQVLTLTNVLNAQETQFFKMDFAWLQTV
jgi:hypothetical protein